MSKSTAEQNSGRRFDPILMEVFNNRLLLLDYPLLMILNQIIVLLLSNNLIVPAECWYIG